MPSPFAGMDPYLEEPNEWGGFHSRFITALSDHLMDAVAPNFFAHIVEHFWLTTSDDPAFVEIELGRAMTARAPAVRTATRQAEPLYDVEMRDRWIEMRPRYDQEAVTILEVLSPFKKVPGTQSRETFLRKRRTVTASQTHWIEIDLLRAGERPNEAAGRSDYYALLKRANQPDLEAWFFDLRDRMPTIAVPLRPPFEDVPLNLQTILETVYTRGHYAEAIDYSGSPPLPRLRPADANWAAERIQVWLAAQGQTATGG